MSADWVWQVIVLPLVFDMKKKLKERTSIVMIVSPLIALMKDQTSMFTEKGISAGYVSGIYRQRNKTESSSWSVSLVQKHYF